jgi:hypothetical protein
LSLRQGSGSAASLVSAYPRSCPGRHRRKPDSAKLAADNLAQRSYIAATCARACCIIRSGNRDRRSDRPLPGLHRGSLPRPCGAAAPQGNGCLTGDGANSILQTSEIFEKDGAGGATLTVPLGQRQTITPPPLPINGLTTTPLIPRRHRHAG